MRGEWCLPSRHEALNEREREEECEERSLCPYPVAVAFFGLLPFCLSQCPCVTRMNGVRRMNRRLNEKNCGEWYLYADTERSSSHTHSHTHTHIHLPPTSDLPSVFFSLFHSNIISKFISTNFGKKVSRRRKNPIVVFPSVQIPRGEKGNLAC